MLNNYTDQYHSTIREQSFAAPFILLLLRHVGCAFCRRTLQEVQRRRSDIEQRGVAIGLVFMDRDEKVLPVVQHYGIADLSRYQDPEQELYKWLGLQRAGLREFFYYRVWNEGLQAGKDHGVSWPDSDALQLPGAFLIDQGHIVAADWKLSPVNPPDFDTLLQGHSESARLPA